ncbi:DUF523 and DUF1722 domain-containing protein [Vibrio sp. S4M6]|uniref:YbgA family protein n=1 Tax=Vibrio sinus TaxID=2946865 RepID=UPI00202A17F9|nr:DUF523 and DUF1722 domain-containing protein [Vibrio sinus]MCL9780828.1 DUF523 and DUF1722 domain-containing protein [Vibrio sinus]
MARKLKIGISACVIGQKVRFDSGHKNLKFCSEELAQFAEFMPVCPEVGIGLPIPRPTIRQIQCGEEIKVSRPDGTGDVTQDLIDFAKAHSNKCDDLSGFIVCAKSPTCGMERVKVYHQNGQGSESNGIGVFTRQIMQALPLLPVEENGRLNDPILRENFITRVFTYDKWLALKQRTLNKHALIEFHTKQKYLVMSHHYESYKSLGQLLARADLSIQDQAQQYISGLMAALTYQASRKSHANTLQHLQGYFKKHLSSTQRQALAKEISSFREGLTPLLVPISLIKHYLSEYPIQYLSEQSYLSPHPQELKLRYGY